MRGRRTCVCAAPDLPSIAAPCLPLQPAQTTLQFPYPLSQIYGTGQAWAYGGSWLK